MQTKIYCFPDVFFRGSQKWSMWSVLTCYNGEAVSPTFSLLISSLSAKHLIEEDTLKQKKNINLKRAHWEIVI